MPQLAVPHPSRLMNPKQRYDSEAPHGPQSHIGHHVKNASIALDPPVGGHQRVVDSGIKQIAASPGRTAETSESRSPPVA